MVPSLPGRGGRCEPTLCKILAFWPYALSYDPHRRRPALPRRDPARQPAGGRGLRRPGRAGPLGPRARAGRRGAPAAGRGAGADHRGRAARRTRAAGSLRRRPGFRGRRGGERAGGGARPPVRRGAARRAGAGGGGQRADADRLRARGLVRGDHRGGARPDHRCPARGAARLRAAARGVHRTVGVRRVDRTRVVRAGRDPGRAAGDPGRPVAPRAGLRAGQRRSGAAAGRVRQAQPGAGLVRRADRATTRRRDGCSPRSARGARTGAGSSWSATGRPAARTPC